MDDKTIEVLYNQIKTEQTPDVWDKIEAALPERDNIVTMQPVINKKKKSLKKYIGIGVAAAACLLVLSVPVRLFFFGAMGGASSDSTASANTAGGSPTEAAYDMEYEAAEEAGYDVKATEADAAAPQAAEDLGVSQDTTAGRKLIRTVMMEIETLEFDAMVSNLKSTVDEYGGYFEMSDISGNRAYEYSRMYGSFVVRIPSSRLDEFLAEAGSLGNVTYKSESTEDVTLQYVDTEAHIDALRVQQEKLMSFLDKAETMEEILQIENSLTDVRYELEYYESMKKQYDNQVDFSTVTMNIQEVKEETPMEEPTFIQRIQDGFTDTILDIAVAGRDLVIWFISSIPYFVIIGAAVCIAVFIIRKVKRK